MVSAYTPALRRRHDDAYSPGGKPTRPEKTTLVYTNILHRLFKDTPIIIGGIEASLRRLAHYDYWSDSVKQGILADAPASLLVYGMGELQMIEIAERLKTGESVKDLHEYQRHLLHDEHSSIPGKSSGRDHTSRISGSSKQGNLCGSV